MAKTTAPLLGFGASGAIGDTLVYASWRGVPYARRHVIPANPRTQAQTLTRDVFRTLSQMWKLLPSDAVNPWNAFATGRKFLGVNAWTGQNIKALRSDPPLTSMETLVASPGANGGLAPTSLGLAPGADTLTATIGLPNVPDGWTLTASQGIAFPDQAPDEQFTSSIIFAEDLATPESLIFPGLTVVGDYVVAIWLLWEKPDGRPAYSVSLADVGTPT